MPQARGVSLGDGNLFSKGDPLFLGFEGEVFPYQGESTTTPVFINDTAYYEKNYALGLAIPQQVNVNVTSISRLE